VTLPLPVGLFQPVFLLGGVLGRLAGEVMCSVPGGLGGGAHTGGFARFLPREYALVGAAAFSTGVTRAISTAGKF